MPNSNRISKMSFSVSHCSSFQLPMELLLYTSYCEIFATFLDTTTQTSSRPKESSPIVEILQYINNFIFSIIFSEATGSVFKHQCSWWLSRMIWVESTADVPDASWEFCILLTGEWKKICTKAVASVLLCFNEKADGCELEREED